MENTQLGIGSLLQDLYTPDQYNPAEYTLLGYDPNATIYGMYGGTGAGMMGEPVLDPATEAYLNMYSDPNMVAGQTGQGAPAQAAAPAQSLEDQNAAVIASTGRAQAAAPAPVQEYHPSQGIMGMPKAQQVGFGGYDAEGIKYDAQGRGYDVLGRLVRDEYGRAAVGLTAEQFGITPQMAARGYTIADMMG